MRIGMPLEEGLTYTFTEDRQQVFQPHCDLQLSAAVQA